MNFATPINVLNSFISTKSKFDLWEFSFKKAGVYLHDSSATGRTSHKPNFNLGVVDLYSEFLFSKSGYQGWKINLLYSSL